MIVSLDNSDFVEILWLDKLCLESVTNFILLVKRVFFDNRT